jgi:hypothetical protein
MNSYKLSDSRIQLKVRCDSIEQILFVEGRAVVSTPCVPSLETGSSMVGPFVSWKGLPDSATLQNFCSKTAPKSVHPSLDRDYRNSIGYAAGSKGILRIKPRHRCGVFPIFGDEMH